MFPSTIAHPWTFNGTNRMLDATLCWHVVTDTTRHGAVLHHSSGEADFDGLPGDELPPREAVKRKLKEDAPAPPESSAD